MNRILANTKYKNNFIDWATDHYKHFSYYPGSFVDFDGEDEIEFTEPEIWDAVNKLFLDQEQADETK
jgi:hypothetical protein